MPRSKQLFVVLEGLTEESEPPRPAAGSIWMIIGCFDDTVVIRALAVLRAHRRACTAQTNLLIMVIFPACTTDERSPMCWRRLGPVSSSGR